MLRALFFILTGSSLLTVAVTKISITEFDVPNSIRSGETAKLICKYELSSGEPKPSEFKWWFRGDGGDPKLLYQRLGSYLPARVERIFVNLNETDNTIEIPNMQPSDSGFYECAITPAFTSSEDEQRKKQEVIVFTQGSGPLLNITKQASDDAGIADDVLITCEAYGVAPHPDLLIEIDGEEIPTTPEIVNHTMTRTFDVRVNVTVNKDAVYGKEVRCELLYNANVTHGLFRDARIYNPDGRPPTQAAMNPTSEENLQEGFPPLQVPESRPVTEAGAAGNSGPVHYSLILLLFVTGVTLTLPYCNYI